MGKVIKENSKIGQASRIRKLECEAEDRERRLFELIEAQKQALWLSVAGIVCLLIVIMCVFTYQGGRIRDLEAQIEANRASILNNADVDKRQEVILSKLNQEYQMKHYQKEGKK